jgi:hypothetical protein
MRHEGSNLTRPAEQWASSTTQNQREFLTDEQEHTLSSEVVLPCDTETQAIQSTTPEIEQNALIDREHATETQHTDTAQGPCAQSG